MSTAAASSRKSRTERAFLILDAIEAELEPLLKLLEGREIGYLPVRNAFDQIRADIADGNARKTEEILRIGILGGRGSGKSTLANALMGEKLLPDSAMMFCTGLPTAIRYQAKPYLRIDSEIAANRFEKVDVAPEEMRRVLYSVARESENPGNTKQVSKISVGLPKKWLLAKEIVDVPGFTRGNPLHQAFAERYAKHYCDVCFVLINNPESIEVGAYQGWEALARIFSDRLDTTVFIINKRDQATAEDVAFIRASFEKFLPGGRPVVYEISSLNVLDSRGDPYQYLDLLEYVNSLSVRQALILVQATLGRLVTNFNSLRELSRLSADELGTLSGHIRQVAEHEFPERFRNLVQRLRVQNTLSGDVPTVDLTQFDLPANPLGLSPHEYASQLVESIRSQLHLLDDLIQQHQVAIYRAFVEEFNRHASEFGASLRRTLSQFEKQFNITSAIEEPRLEEVYPRQEFDPSRIERLKPRPIRLWMERTLPGVLVRDLKFWSAPVNVSAGLVNIMFPVPVALKSENQMVSEIRKRIPEAAIRIMNEYIYDCLGSFVRHLDRSYTQALEAYASQWKTRLDEYRRRVDAAKFLASPATIKALEGFVAKARGALEEVTALRSDE